MKVFLLCQNWGGDDQHHLVAFVDRDLADRACALAKAGRFTRSSGIRLTRPFVCQVRSLA